jgi:hypothetical protein
MVTLRNNLTKIKFVYLRKKVMTSAEKIKLTMFGIVFLGLIVLVVYNVLTV